MRKIIYAETRVDILAEAITTVPTIAEVLEKTFDDEAILSECLKATELKIKSEIENLAL